MRISPILRRPVLLCAAMLAVLPLHASSAPSFAALHMLLDSQSGFSEREFVDPRWYFLVDGLLILYYIGVYKWLHRKRDAEPIVAQYAPPKDLSPGAMRYLLTGDSDRQTVAAVLLDLAARGLVSITCLDNFYLITKRTDRVPPNLPPEEAAAFSVMFLRPLPPPSINIPHPLRGRAVPKGSFLVHPIAGDNFNSLATNIHSALRATCEKKYFTRNLAYSLPAAVLSILCIVGSTFTGSPAYFMAFFILSGIFFINFTPYIRDLLRGRIRGSQNSMYLVVLLMAFMVWTAMFASESKQYTNLFEITLMSAVLLNIGLPALFRTPKEPGRLALNQIEGHREFLTRAEVDRLHRMQDPQWTPGDTTRNLAYAVALDLHHAWEDYLANSDFHSVVWEPSKTKPTLPGMQPPGSGATGGMAFLRQMAWRWVAVILITMVLGFLKPSDILYPKLTLVVVIGGLLALYAPPLFRRK